MFLYILSPDRGSFTEKQKEVGLMAKGQSGGPSRWHAAPDQLLRVVSVVCCAVSELVVSKGTWWSFVVGGEDVGDKEDKRVGQWASLVLLFPSLFLKFFEVFLNIKTSKKI